MIRQFLLISFIFVTFSQAQGCQRKVKSLDKEALAVQTQEKAHKKRLKSIEVYEKRLSSDSIQGEQRADILFLVAEQYFREGRYYFFTEMKRFEKEYETCFNTDGCNTELLLPNHEQSHNSLDKSVASYRLILSDHPNYSFTDKVLFHLAVVLQEREFDKEALGYFERLIKEYAQSSYLPQAYVKVGDYYFTNNNMMKALQAYRRVAEFQNNKVYGYALYKLAWCFYNVQHYDKAIETMKRVVSYTDGQMQSRDAESHQTLREEALKDMSQFFADSKSMDDAIKYFGELGREDLILQMLELLGSIYFEEEDFERCIKVHRFMLARDKLSLQSPDYLYQIITSYRILGLKKEELNELIYLRAHYGRDSQWAQNHSSHVEILEKVERYLEEGFRSVAVSCHKAARKLRGSTESVSMSKLAEQSYRLYLDDFSAGPYSYDIRYMFGELLFDIGDYYRKNRGKDSDWKLIEKYYTDAFHCYSALIEQDPNGEKTQLSLNAIISLAGIIIEERRERWPLPENSPKNDFFTEIEFSPWQEKYIKALESYVELYPNSKETIEYLYEIGTVYFDKNRIDEALERFRLVINLKPRSRLAYHAADESAQALAWRAEVYLKRKELDKALVDYVTLRDLAKEFYDKKGLGNKRFKAQMYGYFEMASAKVAELRK